MPKAFIVYGRDDNAHREVGKFLEDIGITVVPFHLAASNKPIIDTILETVQEGIDNADVVIALFTPDEQSNFHDPNTGEYRAAEKGRRLAGWQPRPNVILETGIAVAKARHKMIIVKSGPIRQISDLDGVLDIDLDGGNAKGKLYDILALRLGLPKDSVRKPRGDFSFMRKRRVRWDDYHDELGELEKKLGKQGMYGTRSSLLKILQEYVTANPEPHSWDSTRITEYILSTYERYADQQATNAAFWCFILYGVFTFDEDDDTGWALPDWFGNLMPYVRLTTRGKALLKRILDSPSRVTD